LLACSKISCPHPPAIAPKTAKTPKIRRIMP
jgi:hypothetical protein